MGTRPRMPRQKILIALYYDNKPPEVVEYILPAVEQLSGRPRGRRGNSKKQEVRQLAEESFPLPELAGKAAPNAVFINYGGHGTFATGLDKMSLKWFKENVSKLEDEVDKVMIEAAIIREEKKNIENEVKEKKKAKAKARKAKAKTKPKKVATVATVTTVTAAPSAPADTK